MQNPNIVGIRFQKVGKIYHFDAARVEDLQVGDFAIVETSRGRQIGEVAELISEPTPPPEGSWKPILRKANPRDLVLRQIWHKKELEATINCRAKLAETKIEGVKIVTSEFTFDGSRLSFLYSTEAEGSKVDLRALRRVMQRAYPRAKVEMRQIGPRDVAKIVGGMGACGLENRCCSMFLTDFSPISIKMAKEQGISLSPSEITGMCGRLRCCLVYEYEQYVEARKTLPKRKKRVVSPRGEGIVLDINPLKESVLVQLDSGNREEFHKEELQPWDELEALRRKAQAPCDRHENGGCDCGKAGEERPAESSSEEMLDLDKAFSKAEESEQANSAGGPAGGPSVDHRPSQKSRRSRSGRSRRSKRKNN